ncbi:MAG TPA: AAA family ATPase [bacterium]|nr:AAA family ATPase [bacterium]
MSKTIIGFTGPISSGKTTAAKYLAEKFNGKIYGFSGPLRDILNRLYLPLERANMAKLSETIREAFGSDLISKTIAADIANDPCDFIILEGLRRVPDLQTMKSLPGFRLLSVNADSKLRWERMTKRGQNADDATKTYEVFLTDEQAEADRDIPVVMSMAEATLDNNGSLEDLYNQLDKLF